MTRIFGTLTGAKLLQIATQGLNRITFDGADIGHAPFPGSNSSSALWAFDFSGPADGPVPRVNKAIEASTAPLTPIVTDEADPR